MKQAFALLDESEEIGLDFEAFYTLMRVVYSVKWEGKKQYGTLTFDEFVSLVENEDGFKDLVQPYMKKSFVMMGNYEKGYNFTLESEAYHLSSSKVQPTQHRL